MSFRWARILPTASTCWIATSTAFAASIPTRQRSLDKLDRIQLLPARETPLNPEAVREFRRRYRLRFTGDLSEQAIYRDVSAGMAPGGIEFFLPLFFERTSHLFEYLPPDSVLVDINDASARALRDLWNGIVDRHEQLRHDRHRPILDPAEVYLTPANSSSHMSRMAQGAAAHL